MRQDDPPAELPAAENGEEERDGSVYAVSNDLQDPLQLARRYADMLNDDVEHALEESGSKRPERLQFKLGRTQEMLEELLGYSRLQNAVPDRPATDYNELLDEVICSYRLTLEEIGGSISGIMREHALPKPAVDRRQLQRILQNLTDNAIKFRSERPLTITVRSQRVRNAWRIGIKDNGSGISMQVTKWIFGMFERGSATQDYPRTGMELAICKRIVRNHGGKIWVRSSPGGGSVYVFSVP